MRRPLTPRQAQILAAVRDYTAEHGYPPTIREICTASGLRSSSSAHAHIGVLIRLGLLERRHAASRGIWPTTGEV
jgi:repressor LexA